MSWFLLQSPPMDGPDNMALDVALMGRARRTGDTVVRVYTWATPTLSFGRNQRAAGAYDAGAIARRGLGVVRRPTGGRALLHHREITYSVTAPAEGRLAEAYERINLLLVEALRRLGVEAAPARPAGRASVPSATPCFAEPAAGELVAGGRKLAGSAQWRNDGALLQHGSILVDDDQGDITKLLQVPVPPAASPATLRGILGRAPGAGEVAEALLHAVRALADPDVRIIDAEPRVLAEARRLADAYREPSWTWRR